MARDAVASTGDDFEWVEAFKKQQGRSPRVLHIGNIANNAYLNAKLLRRHGIEGDVCAYEYYHIMGCPEWEDAPIPESDGFDFHPVWTAAELGGFERPRWFVQGPETLCRLYLRARSSGSFYASWLWALLELQRRVRARWVRIPILRLLAEVAGMDPANAPLPQMSGNLTFARRVLGAGWPFGTVARILVRLLVEIPVLAVSLVASILLLPGGLRALRGVLGETGTSGVDHRRLLARYEGWARTLSGYDAVIGYATDGAIPLAAGKRPYLAFEHGTIRDMPFEDSPAGRICAVVYRHADEVLVTNCDNQKAAIRLGLERYRFVPHPINEFQGGSVAEDGERLRAELLNELDSDYIVFHPARQHWEERRHPNWEKGNDIFIRGFADFVHGVAPRASAIFVEWGATVAQSKALIEELGITARVRWIRPVPNLRMIDYIDACDLVADQFFLGAFGSTMPKALQRGTPAMLRLDEDMHRWCFSEMPPVSNVVKPEDVRDELTRLYREPSYADDLRVRGRDWYARWHSNEAVARKLSGALRDALAREERAA